MKPKSKARSAARRPRTMSKGKQPPQSGGNKQSDGTADINPTGGLGSMMGALLGGLLIGLTEALGGVLFVPSAKSMFAFGLLVLVLLFRPQGILGKKAS